MGGAPTKGGDMAAGPEDRRSENDRLPRGAVVAGVGAAALDGVVDRAPLGRARTGSSRATTASAIRGHLAATWAIVRRDFLVMASYRMAFFTRLAGALFNLVLFYYISRLVRVESFGSPDDYFAFVVVGLIIMQVLNSTLGMAGVVRSELIAGTFERLLLSPFGPVRATLAMVVFPLIFTMAIVLAMLAFAGVAFGIPVEWDTAALALPVGLLGALCFTAFGLVLLSSTIVFKQAVTGIGWIIALMALVSGLYFPIELLPGWMQIFSEVQPLTPAADLMRHFLVGTPLREAAGISIAKLVGFCVVLVPLSVLLVKGAIAVGRRKGTIIEY